jgi:hypothetical protein
MSPSSYDDACKNERCRLSERMTETDQFPGSGHFLAQILAASEALPERDKGTTSVRVHHLLEYWMLGKKEIAARQSEAVSGRVSCTGAIRFFEPIPG